MIALLLLLPVAGAVPDDGGDGPGSSPEDAEPIEPGRHHGNFPPHGSERTHYYKVEVPTGKGVVIGDWQASAEYTWLLVSAPDDTTQFISSSQTHYLGTDRSGTFLLEIRTSSGSLTDGDIERRVHGVWYTFHLDIVDLPPQDDAGSGLDAGSAPDTAVAAGNGTFAGTLGGFDHRDVYRIDAQNGDAVTVRVASGLLPVRYTLGEEHGHVRSGDGQDTTQWVVEDDGPVFLDLRSGAHSEYVGEYAVEVVLGPAPPLSDLSVETITFEKGTEAEEDGRVCYGGGGGETVRLSVEVVNQGPGPASASTHMLEIYSASVHTVACAWWVETPSLAAGERATIEMTAVLGPAAMEVRGEVRLDHRHWVQERDETNNHAVKEFETTLGSLVP